jgi:hypothetical protein
MVQEVSRRPFTAGFRVRARVNPYGNCGGQSGTKAVFCPSSSVYPVNIIPPSFYILIYMTYGRDGQTTARGPSTAR